MDFATESAQVVGRLIEFHATCWHTVDPGTVLIAGSLNQNIGCSGSWLAEPEYVIEDVNEWWFLAPSGRRAGATSLATHGDLSCSARHRSHAGVGLGDERRRPVLALVGRHALRQRGDEPLHAANPPQAKMGRT